jgi:tetratricopeptide (TPR) repeat protein
MVSRCALGDLLIDLDEIDEAERIYRKALEIEIHDPYIKSGLARALSIRSARARNGVLREEARGILLSLAGEGDYVANLRLQNFDKKWERATIDLNEKFRREGEMRSPACAAVQSRRIEDMTGVEQLGRAMIALWHLERDENPASKASQFADAMKLLDMSEGNISDELIPAHVETRGLVLLTDDAQKALDYFEKQIRSYGRGSWIGIRLGAQRARLLLDKFSENDLDDIESPSSESARFALYVARVIQALSQTSEESEIRARLKSLYPRSAEIVTNIRTNNRGELSIENGSEMIGSFLQARWFRPAGVQSSADFDNSEVMQAVVERITGSYTDTFDVLSNATPALAA